MPWSLLLVKKNSFPFVTIFLNYTHDYTAICEAVVITYQSCYYLIFSKTFTATLYLCSSLGRDMQLLISSLQDIDK